MTRPDDVVKPFTFSLYVMARNACVKLLSDSSCLLFYVTLFICYQLFHSTNLGVFLDLSFSARIC